MFLSLIVSARLWTIWIATCVCICHTKICVYTAKIRTYLSTVSPEEGKSLSLCLSDLRCINIYFNLSRERCRTCHYTCVGAQVKIKIRKTLSKFSMVPHLSASYAHCHARLIYSETEGMVEPGSSDYGWNVSRVVRARTTRRSTD